MDTISFYDYRKDYYHGFVAGLLKHNGKYLIKSNKESGLGRYDLVLKTKRICKGMAIILGFKITDKWSGKRLHGCAWTGGKLLFIGIYPIYIMDYLNYEI